MARPLFGIEISGDLTTLPKNAEAAIASGARIAAERIQGRAKLRLRQDMLAGGLGARLALSWQGKTYPAGGKATMNPATLVYSKAPKIVQAFADPQTIRAIEGTYLVIPTDAAPNVMGSRGSREATLRDAELLFGKPLIRPSEKNPQNKLVFFRAIAGKAGRFRPETRGRRRQGRKTQLVLMFVMVRQVHLQKRLNWKQIISDLEKEWPAILSAEIENQLAGF